MRDPRTWRELDRGLLDNVTRQWARAYPGASLHTGLHRPDPQPAIRPVDVEPWPPQQPRARTLERRRDDRPASARTWEKRPEESSGRSVYLAADAPRADAGGSAVGRPGGVSREDALDALRAKAADGAMSASAFLKEAARIERASAQDDRPGSAGAPGVDGAAGDGSRAEGDAGRFPWKLHAPTREVPRPPIPRPARIWAGRRSATILSTGLF